MTLEDYRLDRVIRLYLTACRVEGKSPNTVVAYRETLMQFLQVAKEQGFAHDVSQITPEHIYTWLASVKARGVSDHTLHRRHREARFLFVWLERLGVIDRNPFEHIKNIKLPQKVIRPISAGDIQKLLKAKFPNEFLATRNRAIIMLLLDTGIRLNELISLKLEDLDVKSQRLRILNGKMKKQRVVRVGDVALEYLRRYLEVRGDEPGQLFLSKHGKAIRPNSIRVMLRRLAERAAVPHVHPRKFRHLQRRARRRLEHTPTGAQEIGSRLRLNKAPIQAWSLALNITSSNPRLLVKFRCSLGAICCWPAPLVSDGVRFKQGVAGSNPARLTARFGSETHGQPGFQPSPLCPIPLCAGRCG